MTTIRFDLKVDFAERELRGWVEHPIEAAGTSAQELVLDTRELSIESATVEGEAREWTLEAPDPVQGAKLRVRLKAGDRRVRVDYRSKPEASGLQWLTPSQTAGRELPFVYSQGQSIHTRSWLPCVDDPARRVCFEATLRVPEKMTAVMAAEALESEAGGCFRFRLAQPVPAYLIAFAVGDLAFEATGPRSGVWSEPELLAASAYEFGETEQMIQATERLFGPYRWGRYDLLVLPPSFPLGGMENPRLTFATPTVLAGDRSLVSLVAHELAHSWSGNLVTNASWDDFWLNEGFTVYLERRVVEEVYGRERSEMEAVIGRSRLEATLAQWPADARDSWLKTDIGARHPDDAITDVPYEKGYLFLRRLEELVGRGPFDSFLREYFDAHAFETMDTERFVARIRTVLLPAHPGLESAIDIDAWVYGPGIPDDAPKAHCEAFERIEAVIEQLMASNELPDGTERWSTHEWIHFLRKLPRDASADLLDRLGKQLMLDRTRNSEVRCEWLRLCVEADRPQMGPALRSFLGSVGRRKFLQPLYDAMAKTSTGLELAREIYAEARPGYHNFVRAGLDEKLLR